MITFENAFKKIKNLVTDFQANEPHFLSPAYDEATLRQRFIDEFFRALGWNLEERNPYKQEVKIEKNIQEGKKQKRADYAFYISPNFRDAVFIAEAKKPSRNLENDEDYFQAIRYGYHASVPVAILFNFKELHILDCRDKPPKKDILKKHLIKKYHYTEFTDEKTFKEIYNLFSRESVANHSIVHFIGNYKRSHKSIDEALLDELDEIRNLLSRSLKKQNIKLESEPLTEAVQRIINRLVLLRFLEDKFIEQEYYVSRYAESKTAWKDFISDCARLNAKYNGIIFREHFIDKGNFKGPEPKIFSEICFHLSHLNEEGYDFDLIPIHILGSIYERFLGKIIHATPKRVKVEDKEIIRKAGGVYYTPQYIVDYIVENSIGKLIAGKSPSDISKMKFADIACGSGTFLISAYDYILRYHHQWYNEHPYEAEKDGCIFSEGKWVLSLEQRKKILLNNIFGIDIDHQAVEVTQLSLYLKLLEENGMYLHPVQERILPDLSKNIICGNSIVDRDININGNLFEEIDDKKLRPMNIRALFPEGFDAVIGNPPWGQKAVEFTETLKKYLKRKYPASSEGILDMFRFFVERAISLVKINGYFGQVLPDIILLKNYPSTRRHILDRMNITRIDHWGMAFRQVNLECCTIIGKVETPNPKNIVQATIHKNEGNIVNYIPQNTFLGIDGYKFNLLINPLIEKIINKLHTNKKLSDFVEPHEGIHSGNIRHKLFLDKKKNKNCKKLIFGKDEVQRYYLEWDGKWVNYSKDVIDKKKKEYAGLGKKEYFEIPKLVIRRTGDYILANVDYDNYYFSNNVFVCPPKKSNHLDLKYILGLLNSRLITWYYRIVQPRKGKLFSELKINILSNIPIVDIDLTNNEKKSLHDKVVKLVDEMLQAQKQLRHATTDNDKLYYKRKCEETDKEIDTLVFQLYGLTPEEIDIIEHQQ